MLGVGFLAYRVTKLLPLIIFTMKTQTYTLTEKEAVELMAEEKWAKLEELTNEMTEEEFNDEI